MWSKQSSKIIPKGWLLSVATSSSLSSTKYHLSQVLFKLSGIFAFISGRVCSVAQQEMHALPLIPTGRACLACSLQQARGCLRKPRGHTRQEGKQACYYYESLWHSLRSSFDLRQLAGPRGGGRRLAVRPDAGAGRSSVDGAQVSRGPWRRLKKG
jgi:hypothetical protein